MLQSWEPSWHRSRHTLAAVRHTAWLKRHLRAQSLRRRRDDAPGWGWFASYADDLALGKREMARALRKYLHAPDALAACGMLVLYPLLQMESARERLKRASARARARGDAERTQLLEARQAMLELACKDGVIAVVRSLTQKNQEGVFEADGSVADVYDI